MALKRQNIQLESSLEETKALLEATRKDLGEKNALCAKLRAELYDTKYSLEGIIGLVIVLVLQLILVQRKNYFIKNSTEGKIAELERASSKLQNSERKEAELADELQYVHRDLDELRNMMAETKAEGIRMSRELEEAKRDLKYSKEEEADLRAVSDKQREKLRELTEQMRQKDQEIGVLGSQVQTLLKDVQTAEETEADLKKNIGKLRKELQELSDASAEEIQSVKRKLKEKVQEIQLLQMELEASKLAQQAADPKSSSSKAGDEGGPAVSLLGASGSTLKLLQQENDQLSELLASKEKEFRLLKTQLESAQFDNQRLEMKLAAALNRSPEKANTEADRELRRLQDELQDTKDDSQRASDKLKRQIDNLNRELGELQLEHQTLSKRLRERTTELTESNLKLEELKMKYDRLSRDKDQELEEVRSKLHRAQSVSQSRGSQSSIDAAPITEAKGLKDRIADLEDEIGKLKRLNKQKDQQATELLDKIEDLERRLKGLREAEQTIDDLTKNIQKLQKNTDYLQKDNEELKSRLSQAKQRSEATQGELDEANQKVMMLTKNVNSLRQEVENLKDSETSLKQQLQASKMQKDPSTDKETKSLEPDGLQRTIEALKLQVSELEADNLKFATRLKDKLSMISELESQLDDMRRKNRELLVKASDADVRITPDRSITDPTQLAQLKQELERTKSLFKQKEAELEDLLSKHAGTQKALASAREEISEQRETISRLSRKASDIAAQSSASGPTKEEVERMKGRLAEMLEANNDLNARLREKQNQMIKMIQEKDNQIEQIQLSNQERHIANQRKLQEVIMRHEETEADLKDAKIALGEIKETLQDRAIPDRRIKHRVEELINELAGAKAKLKEGRDSQTDRDDLMRGSRATLPKPMASQPPPGQMVPIEDLELLKSQLSREVRGMKDTVLRAEQERSDLESRLQEAEQQLKDSNKDRFESGELRSKLMAAQDALHKSDRLLKEYQRCVEDLITNPTVASLLQEDRSRGAAPPSDQLQATELLPDCLRRFIRSQRPPNTQTNQY